MAKVFLSFSDTAKTQVSSSVSRDVGRHPVPVHLERRPAGRDLQPPRGGALARRLSARERPGALPPAHLLSLCSPRATGPAWISSSPAMAHGRVAPRPPGTNSRKPGRATARCPQWPGTFRSFVSSWYGAGGHRVRRDRLRDGGRIGIDPPDTTLIASRHGSDNPSGIT